jgi:hypothetical protein
MHVDHKPFVNDPCGASRDRRHEERVASGASAIARIPASPHRVTLIDVSRTGCQIRVDGLAVPAGATVNLDFGPGRQISGQVAWSQPRTAGIQFDRPLSGILGAALGVESAVAVEIEPETRVEPVVQERALRLPHWLRSLLGRAA